MYNALSVMCYVLCAMCYVRVIRHVLDLFRFIVSQPQFRTWVMNLGHEVHSHSDLYLVNLFPLSLFLFVCRLFVK